MNAHYVCIGNTGLKLTYNKRSQSFYLPDLMITIHFVWQFSALNFNEVYGYTISLVHIFLVVVVQFFFKDLLIML